MSDPFSLPPLLSPAPPRLPRKWRAVALLTPYRDEEVFAAQVEYDWSQSAMMVTMWGLDGSARQRLFVDDEFFVLSPPGEKDSKTFGPLPSTTPVPAPDWLAPHGMTNVGAGVVMGAECDWFVGYSPNVNGYQNPPPPPDQVPMVCNWAWFHKKTGFPFRLFFTNADNPYLLPELGTFSMTIFTAFEADDAIDLKPMVDSAHANAVQPEAKLGQAVSSAKTPQDLQSAINQLLPGPFAVDPVVMAGKLVKGLAPPPVNAPLPEWTDRLCITGYTYPTAQKPNVPPVLPMRVFYDWPKGRMLTRCSLSVSGFEDVPVQDLILDTAITHIVIRNPNGSHVCGPTVPVGLPRPHWAKEAGGKPKAVIRDNPVLGPGETLHVSVIASNGGRWFWVWYTPQNDGRLFMETPQFGDVGLVLTDYTRFDHAPPPFPDAAFVVPADCLQKTST